MVGLCCVKTSILTFLLHIEKSALYTLYTLYCKIDLKGNSGEGERERYLPAAG